MNNYYVYRDVSQKFIDFLDEKGIDWERLKWGNTDVIHFQLYNDYGYNCLMNEYHEIKINEYLLCVP